MIKYFITAACCLTLISVSAITYAQVHSLQERIKLDSHHAAHVYNSKASDQKDDMPNLTEESRLRFFHEAERLGLRPGKNPVRIILRSHSE